MFNVSLQIQEDNMKSLALFSEYARVALHADKKQRQAAAADSLDAGELETKLATVDSDGDEGDETKAAEARASHTAVAKLPAAVVCVWVWVCWLPWRGGVVRLLTTRVRQHTVPLAPPLPYPFRCSLPAGAVLGP